MEGTNNISSCGRRQVELDDFIRVDNGHRAQIGYVCDRSSLRVSGDWIIRLPIAAGKGLI